MTKYPQRLGLNVIDSSVIILQKVKMEMVELWFLVLIVVDPIIFIDLFSMGAQSCCSASSSLQNVQTIPDPTGDPVDPLLGKKEII